MASVDQLEQQLSELESRASSSRRDWQSAGAALLPVGGAAASSARVLGFDEIASELDVYEKVLQVLSGETNKLQELVKRSDEYQLQQKSKLDALQTRVSIGSVQHRTTVCILRERTEL